MKNHSQRTQAQCLNCTGFIKVGEYCMQLGHYYGIGMSGSIMNRPVKLHIDCVSTYTEKMLKVIKLC